MIEALQPVLQLLHHLSSIVVPSSPLVTTSIATKAFPDGPFSTWFVTRPPLFELEPLILACAIFFCRFVTKTGSLTGCSHDVHSASFEFILRTIISVVLGVMAFMGMEYELLCSVHLWSHVLPWGIGWWCRVFGLKDELRQDLKKSSSKKESKTKRGLPPSLMYSMTLSLMVLLSFPVCLLICRFFSSPSFYTILPTIIPVAVKDAILYMFPVTEMTASYNIIAAFYTTPEQKKVLHDMLRHLLFVTCHIQFGLGHIGIDFLTSEQKRKNMLIRMDVDNPDPDADHNAKSNGKGNEKNNRNEMKSTFDPSRKFRRSAPTFIVFCVLPYMFQIILFGNLNKFSFMYVRNQIHNSVRIDELFNHVSFKIHVVL